MAQIALGQTLVPNHSGKWMGFDKTDSLFDGKEMRLVYSRTPLPGKPWVWRARFPEWHTKMDSILLEKGFNIAYINTDGMYGSDRAIEVWDNFYCWVTSSLGWQNKVVLEGVSRGGLFVLNWSIRNPEKVASIYLEAPVCDFKSWPAGWGDGLGSDQDWKKLMAEYGFENEEQSRIYQGNPIDQIQKLAKHKVPIMIMIGLDDKHVPPKENALPLAEKYIGSGGPVTIIPCTSGTPTMEGHHFPIETPSVAAEFLSFHQRKNGSAPLFSDAYHHMRNGLQNSRLVFERTQKGRVAFLGGSITYNPGWRDSVKNYLVKRFPRTTFEFVDAGIPSMGTTPGAFRLERDVLSKGKIDLLFEEAAVNDHTNGRSPIEQVRGMEGIVRHTIRDNPAVDIVMMHFVDPEKMKTYRNGKVPEVIENHERVAEHYGIPTINLAKEVTDRIDHGEFTWEGDFQNLHPSPFGQQVYANSIIHFLDRAFGGRVDPDDKAIARELPQPLDNNSYDNGKLATAISSVTKTKGWLEVQDWEPSDGVGTRENYVNVPMLISKLPKKKLNFVFHGSAVGIAVAAGPDAATIAYRIDKGDWHYQDLFTPWSHFLHLPWYYTLGVGLDEGRHTLQIKLAGTKNSNSKGNAVRIRYFYWNATGDDN